MSEHSNKFPLLFTERLLLRQLSEQNAENIFLLRSDKMVNRYLDRNPCNSKEEALDFIGKINEKNYTGKLPYWGIALKKTNILAGTICLFGVPDDKKKCEIGFELLPVYQGKGLMHEAATKIIDYAFQIAGLHTIEAYAHKDNLSSIRLLTKLRFVKTTDRNLTTSNLVKFYLQKTG